MHTSRTRRRVIAGCVATAAAAAVIPAAAHADGGPALRSIDRPVSAAALGLDHDASPRALARAALERSAAHLGITGADQGLRLQREDTPGGRQPGATPLHMLRYGQTVGGLRVLWSRLDVAVAKDRVVSIDATTVPLRGELSGVRRISSKRALDLAAAAVPGPETLSPAQLIAYAGEPRAPRAPRRAYVVRAGAPKLDAPPVSVVIDAESGRVLKRWTGETAPSAEGSRAPEARAVAAGQTALFQIANFAKQPAVNNYPYGKTDRVVWANGNGYTWDTGGTTTEVGNGNDANLNTMAANALNTGRFFCLTRDYCGRDGGNPGASGNGDFNRLFLVGNWRDNGDADASQYQSGDDHIMIGADDRLDRDVFSHEFGHLIDRHYQDDYIATFQSREVTEALADMFFIDDQRSQFYNDDDNLGDGGGFVTDFSSHTKAGLDGPHDMSQYDCKTGDEHENRSILVHAYWQLTRPSSSGGVGHDIAGYLLQYIPWRLPADRTMGSVRWAFRVTAEGLYGANSWVVPRIAAAFDHVGVGEGTRRNCPPPPVNWPPKVCEKKPDLPQCEAPPILPPGEPVAERASKR